MHSRESIIYLADPNLYMGVHKIRLDNNERLLHLPLIKYIEIIGSHSSIPTRESALKKGLRVIRGQFMQDTGKSISMTKLKLLYRDVRFPLGFKICIPNEIAKILKAIENSYDIAFDDKVQAIFTALNNGNRSANCLELFVPKHYQSIIELSQIDLNPQNIFAKLLIDLEDFHAKKCFK
jgi:hypothetical protein